MLVTSIDVPLLFREVRAFCDKPLPAAQRARADLLARIKPHMQAWYAGWEKKSAATPLYQVNSRM